jgi:hypothetical protein
MYLSKLVAPLDNECVRLVGPRFNASHFYPGDYTRKQHPWVSTILWYQEPDLGPFFTAVFLKMVAQSQKRRTAAVSSSPPSSFLDYRSPVWNADGAWAAKIGRRSSTALHVWSGRADASSSDVP